MCECAVAPATRGPWSVVRPRAHTGGGHGLAAACAIDANTSHLVSCHFFGIRAPRTNVVRRCDCETNERSAGTRPARARGPRSLVHNKPETTSARGCARVRQRPRRAALPSCHPYSHAPARPRASRDVVCAWASRRSLPPQHQAPESPSRRQEEPAKGTPTIFSRSALRCHCTPALPRRARPVHHLAPAPPSRRAQGLYWGDVGLYSGDLAVFAPSPEGEY